ncbi:MAG: hypothetical protein ACFFA2_06320 [Promethearchaeota archaeon]
MVGLIFGILLLSIGIVFDVFIILFYNNYTILGIELFFTGVFLGPICTIFGISMILPSKRSTRIFWVIIGCVLGGLMIYYGIYLLLYAMHLPIFNPQYSIAFIFPYVCIIGGTLLIVGSPLNFARNSKKRKKLDSMTQLDLVNMFNCPKCGTIGAIYFVKLVQDKFLVKQKCPFHGGRHFELPIRLKDGSISHFLDAIFRCPKCGQEAKLFHAKYSGPWALITVDCPTHGLKVHKIWNSIYNEITKSKTKA